MGLPDFDLGQCVSYKIQNVKGSTTALNARPGSRLTRMGQCGLACVLATLAGCAIGPTEPPPREPAAVRALIENLIPASVADRKGWANDIYFAFSSLKIPPSDGNICATLAIVEQESTWRADPPVANLGKIARAELYRRGERYKAPQAAIDLSLKVESLDGRSYGERIDALRTEKELSELFDEMVGRVPLGERFLSGFNPVRTGGAMQVSIAFAEGFVKEYGYPYKLKGSVRDEVFTRRGGLYFGIAHLLDYPADYPKAIYRFADFNAGRYASRNAAFQEAVSTLTGIPLDLDGDLVVHGDASGRPGATEIAVRSLGRPLGLDDAQIRRALEKDEGPDFAETALYRKVFELADRQAGRAVPRARVPKIVLRSPKITRSLTTEWFATRVDERHRNCLARAEKLGRV